MKTLRLVLFLAGVMVLSGCAQPYVMTLTNGLRITSASKPKLKGSYYVYTDAAGKEHTEPASRVREIAPASMAEDDRNRFKPQSK